MTTIAYNTFGQPTSVQGPIATEPPMTFAYDTNGNLITTTDPLGNATHRVYDAVSRLTSLTDPRGLQTQFRYDGVPSSCPADIFERFMNGLSSESRLTTAS